MRGVSRLSVLQQTIALWPDHSINKAIPQRRASHERNTRHTDLADFKLDVSFETLPWRWRTTDSTLRRKTARSRRSLYSLLGTPLWSCWFCFSRQTPPVWRCSDGRWLNRRLCVCRSWLWSWAGQPSVHRDWNCRPAQQQWSCSPTQTGTCQAPETPAHQMAAVVAGYLSLPVRQHYLQANRKYKRQNHVSFTSQAERLISSDMAARWQ